MYISASAHIHQILKLQYIKCYLGRNSNPNLKMSAAVELSQITEEQSVENSQTRQQQRILCQSEKLSSALFWI